MDEFEALQTYESKERIEPAVMAALDLGLLSKPKMYKDYLILAET